MATKEKTMAMTRIELDSKLKTKKRLALIRRMTVILNILIIFCMFFLGDLAVVFVGVVGLVVNIILYEYEKALRKKYWWFKE